MLFETSLTGCSGSRLSVLPDAPAAVCLTGIIWYWANVRP